MRLQRAGHGICFGGSFDALPGFCAEELRLFWHQRFVCDPAFLPVTPFPRRSQFEAHAHKLVCFIETVVGVGHELILKFFDGYQSVSVASAPKPPQSSSHRIELRQILHALRFAPAMLSILVGKETLWRPILIRRALLRGRTIAADRTGS